MIKIMISQVLIVLLLILIAIIILFQEEIIKNKNILSEEINNSSLFNSKKIIFLYEITDKNFAQIEECLENKKEGVNIYIDAAATLFLIGSEVDWSQDKLQSSFTFNNPNESARCGWGESFTV